MHRRRDGTTHQAGEPVVVEAVYAELLLIDGPAAALRLDAVLAGEVFGEELLGNQSGVWSLKAGAGPACG